jgi:hypothetical protein
MIWRFQQAAKGISECKVYICLLQKKKPVSGKYARKNITTDTKHFAGDSGVLNAN